MTVHNVQITEGRAVELNFTLAPVVGPGSTVISFNSTHGSKTTGTTTIRPSDTTQTPVVPSTGSNGRPTEAPVHQPIQPQEFRHHNYADMELFLRKYSSDFPSITYLYSVGRSVDSRELYVMVISDNPREHEQGTFPEFCAILLRGLPLFTHFHGAFLSFCQCQASQSSST